MTRPPIPLAAHLKDRLPSAVQEIIFTCLRKPREERYPTMRQLSHALRVASAA